MVGLKAFWILLSTLMLAACVPQTKQTECSSNEAFNASLRTCVPIVQGASSFINISNFTPQFTQTRSKDDTTTLTFSISVSNPYNQSYSVEWERVFNAGPVFMCSNSLSCSFPASFLGTTLGEVGTHILTAKIKDTNGAVVDSHSFELKINELPKPVINIPVTPSSLSFDVYPTEPRVQFSFNIRNNGATISPTDNYRTVWTILKNGSFYLSETDSFTNFTSTGTNTAYLGTSPTPLFNPGTFGVGTYSIRASVQNDNPGEIVAEQYWNVTVKLPALTKVTNVSSPDPGVTITAHNGIDYATAEAFTADYSWIYGSPATYPNFCVTVNDRDGVYASDGKSVLVKFYLNNSGGDICTKKTVDTAGTQIVCLNDAVLCENGGSPIAFDKSVLKFNNSSSTVQQLHKVTARVFDESSSLELGAADVLDGSYPVEWKVLVKPINTAPVMAFGSSTNNPTGCTSSGAFTKSNCQVTQGSHFKVSFSAIDDFYTSAINPNEFKWDIKLKRNGADITSTEVNTHCYKDFGTADIFPNLVVPGFEPEYQYNATTPTSSEWVCWIAVPHFDSSGPLNPSVGNYQVMATMQDSGSPIGGAGLISQSLAWNLVVTEANTNIDLRPQTILAADSNVSNGVIVLDPSSAASFATEKDTVSFRLNIDDDERDDFEYRISLCTDNSIACATSTIVTSPSFVNVLRGSQVANPLLITGLLYTIPEDFLISKHATSINIDTATSRLVYFKVEAIDKPHIPSTPEVMDTEYFSFYVRNFNPAPVINTATASPAVGTNTTVYSGFQFTIDPGTVSDASVPSIERNLQYQWYAKIGAGAWSAVTGATTKVLRYTPGNTSSVIDLKLCVGDGTAAHPVSSTGTCTANWSVTPKTFINDLEYTDSDGFSANSLNNELAVWYDETNAVPNTQVIYSAYVDNTNDIFVEKTVKDASGNIILSTPALRFPALDASAASLVSNLSITGTADSLYIAYIASSVSAPTNMSPYVRRIDKSGTSKTGMPNSATFGFKYDDYEVTTLCSPSVDCTIIPADGAGSPVSITFGGTGRLVTGDTIKINNTTFTANSGVGSNDICDSNTCGGPNSTASNIANKINSSSLTDLQGIRAVASGPTLSLYGLWNQDYLDFDGTVAAIPNLVVAENGLGKIFIQGTHWHLPFINSSLSGSNQNNITVLTGMIDNHMRSSAPNTNVDLLDIGKVAVFDHSINTSGEMVIAAISGDVSNSGKLSLYRYVESAGSWSIFDAGASGSPTDQESMDIMSSYDFEYVKLAASTTGNPYYYVIAREKSINGSEYHIGRYNPDLDTAATPSENILNTRISISDVNYLSDTKIKLPQLLAVTGFSEARIFFQSVGTGILTLPHIARWKSDDTVTCGGCISLNGPLEHQPNAKMGISQIANDLTLGSAGALVGENINDVVFTLYSSDLADDDIFRPQLGIVNIEAESIQSTTADASGRWHPPFILDQ